MVCVLDNKMWLLGGGIARYHPFRAYNDVWNSPDGKTWRKVLDRAPWPPRIWSTSAVYRDRIWILGGFRSEPTWNNFNDIWYSGDGAHWEPLISEDIWSARHELSAYVFQDKLWVVAGNSWPLMNDAWYLDIPGLTFVSQPVVEEFAEAEYTYRARADFNKSGKPVCYRLVQGPAWLSIDPATGVLRGTPATPGDSAVDIEAFDTAKETARQSYTLHVIP
jgi:hypothetical protein